MFNIDSKFSQVLGRVFDLMILNIMFIFTCVPIITMGASITAMYYVTIKMVNGTDSFILKAYLKSFKQNFKQATAIWVTLNLGMCLLVMGFLQAGRSSGLNMYARYIFVFFIILLLFVLFYSFPLLSRFDNTVKNTLKNAAILAIHYFPWSIIILAINLCPIVLYVTHIVKVIGIFTMMMIMMGFSLMAFVCSFIYENKIFSKYIKKNVKEI